MWVFFLFLENLYIPLLALYIVNQLPPIICVHCRIDSEKYFLKVLPRHIVLVQSSAIGSFVTDA